MNINITFSNSEKKELLHSFNLINRRDMPRVLPSHLSKIPDTDQLNTLALNTLGKIIEFLEKATIKKPIYSQLYGRGIQLVAKTTVSKIIELADKTKLPKIYTKVYCQKLIELTQVTPENYGFFRLSSVFAGKKLARISIVSNLFSSIDDHPNLKQLRQIHMADRLGILFLILVAVQNTPYEYRIGETQITIGKGSKKENTDAAHCSLITQLERRPKTDADAPFDKEFILNWYLYLAMNCTHKIPKNDNVSIDKRIENRLRAVVVREINNVAQGKKLTTCYERAVTSILEVTSELVNEYKGKQRKAIKHQKQGIFWVLNETNNVDPEFYRMQGRLTGKKILNNHTWEDLSPMIQSKVFKSLQKQINKHPSKHIIETHAPALILRLL